MNRLLLALLFLVALPAFGATTGQLIVIHPSAGSSTALDLGDDGTDESTGLLEIATTGDTNSIATNPSADKLLIDFSIPWLLADALSANGANCPAGQYPLGVDASGAAESCTVDDVGTDDQTAVEVPYTPTTNTDWTDPDPVNLLEGLDDLAARVTTDEAALATHTGLPDAHFDHADTLAELNTQIGASLADGPHTSSLSFSGITTGTNTNAAMVVGTGASLKVASTGTIDASAIDGDGDGVRNVYISGSEVLIDANDDGTADVAINSNGLYHSASFANRAFVFTGINVSSTNPTLLPRGGDSNTGVGSAGGDDLRLIAGGSSGLGVTTTAVTNYIRGVNSPSTATCADSADANPGFVVITPTTSEVYLTVLDVDGCDVVISESGAVPGQRLEITVVSIAGGTANFTDSSGVQEMGTGCSLPLYGTLGAKYIDTGANDRWVKRFCETDV